MEFSRFPRFALALIFPVSLPVLAFFMVLMFSACLFMLFRSVLVLLFVSDCQKPVSFDSKYHSPELFFCKSQPIKNLIFMHSFTFSHILSFDDLSKNETSLTRSSLDGVF